MRVYLAGPMSGRPQFNFPLFKQATSDLRQAGWDVISPAELDEQDSNDAAYKSLTGDLAEAAHSWGFYLSRDVRIIADDGIEGIVFLPEWETSRGARLEATVGLNAPSHFQFYRYEPAAKHKAIKITTREVCYMLGNAQLEYALRVHSY